MATATEVAATERVRQHPHEGRPVHKRAPGMHDGVILATAAAARTRADGGSDLDMQAMAFACMHAVEFSKTAAPLSGVSPSRGRAARAALTGRSRSGPASIALAHVPA